MRTEQEIRERIVGLQTLVDSSDNEYLWRIHGMPAEARLSELLWVLGEES